MVEGIAPCRCRVVTRREGAQVDSSSCLLNPVLEAWSQIEARAAEIARGQTAAPPVRPVSGRERTTPARNRRGGRWGPVQEAIANLNRVLEEQQIPRGSLTCGLCQGPIEEGTILTFHGSCYDDRSKPQTDVRALKEEALRVLARGSAARELILAMPDKISKVEMPGYFIAILNLLKLPEERS